MRPMEPTTVTDSPPSSSSSFELLHEGIQRWIWEQRWAELRPIQDRAIPVVLAHDRDVILAARTAGGKTEAAFLPILSHLATQPHDGIGCLALSPLKALINDQFGRLETMCRAAGLSVGRWHGDVSQAHKRDVLGAPPRLLLITPESLEALFVRQGSRVRKLFAGLQYLVIDELHAFIGSERGRQVQSLLHRLELALRQRRIPRIALSATLGDMRIAAEFLRPGAGDDVVCIESMDGGQELQLQLRGYVHMPPAPTNAGGDDTEVEDPGEDLRAMARHMFRTLRGGDNLIFANARTTVERLADMLRTMSDEQRLPNEFLPHHGSLARDLRQDAEALLKDEERPGNVICTTTLELGLDIGSVDGIAQVGCPPSVAALRQRLGRSGRRRGKPAVLRLYVAEEQITPQTPFHDTLRAELVQAIAMVNLLLKSWCETPRAGQLHLSTLIQQLLSIIAQHGSVRADEAWRALCGSGPFSGLTQQGFGQLLRAMGERELIAQTGDGSLVIGAVGERLVDHYSFYAAFSTPEEYRLITRGRTIGSIPITSPLASGMALIFAGRRWRVLGVDEEHRTIELEPARGGRPPRFVGGGPLVDDRVRREMLSVYASDEAPRYLDPTAAELLREGRKVFRDAGLGSERLLTFAEHTLLFPWAGDRAVGTLGLLFLRAKVAFENHGIALAVQTGEERVLELLSEIVHSPVPDPAELAELVANKRTEKYDWALSDELLCLDFASRALDVHGARTAASEVLAHQKT